MTTPSFRDAEQISALLDGKLPQNEAARLQMRIAADPELSSIYRQLSQTRTLLRKLPARRAPRNFTLTPKMAGVKAPTPRNVPLFRFASAFASLLLILTFAANGIGQLAANAPASAPAYGMGGEGLPIGGGLELEAPAQKARPQSGAGSEAEPIAPAAPAPSGVAEDSANAPAEETMNLAAEPTAEEMPAAKMTEEGYSTRGMPQVPAREPFQVPGWLQLALLVTALLTGGAAWFINWQAQIRFGRNSKK
jgi:hypothetical protein